MTKSLSAQQTFDYWLNLLLHRQPFVVLCNFDEFWFYDFNTQRPEPPDCVPVKDLACQAVLNFLYPRKFLLVFGNSWVEITGQATRNVANIFKFPCAN